MNAPHPSIPPTPERAGHAAPVTLRAWLPAVLLQVAALPLVPGVYVLLRSRAPMLAPPGAWGVLALLMALAAGWLWWCLGRPRAEPLPPAGRHANHSPATAPELVPAEELERLADAALNLTAAGERSTDFHATRTLLARLSHELRTPLSAIIGFIGLVEDGIYKSEQERRDYLHNAHSSAISLLEMINDVLEYSKITAGHLTLSPGQVNPADLVESVAIFLAPQAHQKGLEIECVAGDGLPLLMRADVGRLRQILINLAANAIKFTGQGQVLVRAEMAPPLAGTPGRRAVRFSVEDSGPGISPVDQQRMFDSYVQLQEGAGGGTGLGLAISKQLVTLMGGEIGVESALGQGSRFHVTLPLDEESDEGPAAAETPLAGQRLLLLAPNAVLGAAQAARLRRLGATVSLERGVEAGQAYLCTAPAGRQPQAVLVDDGIAATRLGPLSNALRQAGGAPAAPLVYLSSTGIALPDAVRHQAGIAAFLAKPLATEQVQAVLGPLAATGTLAQQPDLAHAALLPDPSGVCQVLVAEDNLINQKLIQALLHKAGYGVTLVGNGREAVEQLAQRHFDLVLMDIQMPVLDGVSAAREVRRTQGNRNVPIVAMTANTMDESRQLADVAFEDYLAKPIDPRELTRVLGQWVVATSRRTRQLGREPARGQAPHLDTEHLGDLAAYARAHNFALFDQLLRLFLRQLDEAMTRLSAAVEAEDWPAVSAAADELRTIGGSFGAPRLAELAGDMAALCGEGLRVLIRDLEPQLASESRLLHKELQGRLAAETQRRI